MASRIAAVFADASMWDKPLPVFVPPHRFDDWIQARSSAAGGFIVHRLPNNRPASLMPHSLQQNRPRTVALNLVSADKESHKKGENQADGHALEQQTAKQLRDLRNLQQRIDDLLVLSNAQHCLQASGEIDNAQRQVFEMEMEKLMTDVGQMAKMNPPQPAMAITDTSQGKDPRTQTSRVQLRLSKPLVKILTAFGKAQRRPSTVVEKTMWRDAQIRDAAEILGVATPTSKRSLKAQRTGR